MKPTKRVFDVLGAAAGLLLLWPLFLVVSLLIKLEDGGPVFFQQERVGLRGRGFRLLKFRSMRVSDGAGPLLTVGDDPRVTRLGRWLRALKLDELPQLINVLRGEMSLVGPRPEVPRYVALYTPAQRRVLEFVPGITDPASIRFWNESSLLASAGDPEFTYAREILPEKIRLQLDYGQEATVWRDFLLILDTLRRLYPSARPVLLDRLIRHRRLFIVLAHLVLAVLGYWAAFELRFDFAVAAEDWALMLQTLPLLLVIRLGAYAAFGLNRGYWQQFGLQDFLRLSQASTASSALFVVALWAVGWFPGVPRSVLLLDWVAAIFLAGGARVAARSLREAGPFARMTGRRTLVIGVGDKAARLLREIRQDRDHALRVMGLVVDHPADRDRMLEGARVVGTIDALETLVARYRVEFLVIALDRPSGEQMDRVVERCLRTGVEFKTLPSLQEVLAGVARADQLRSVKLEDLLGREPVTLTASGVETLRGQVVMVTGGAGSIGSELARQIARVQPARLILLDQAESPLYFVHLELAAINSDLDIVPIVGDVTDEARIARICQQYRPDAVIHAAAYKHVPLMEHNVFEAVRNNVFGTLCVAEAAVACGAQRFVLISTDKAVKPTSVMGATKRIAERIVLGLPELRAAATDFRAVRFGNVLGSAGSVVPLFEQQLERGGPLTVTHPDVERYFMTIPEAAQLVLEAATLKEAARRICMLDMGRPVRILDVAEKLIRLSGREPGRDIGIVFTGLRPGEKLREELMSDLETTAPSSVPKVRIVQADEHGGGVAEGLALLSTALALADITRLVLHVRALVPECTLGHQIRTVPKVVGTFTTEVS